MVQKVNLFIVGEPKCGTTSLHSLLDGHSDISMSIVKETGFFLKNDSWREIKSKEDYQKNFLDSNKSILGESTTRYIRSSDAAKKIYRYNPNSKIIVLFREPVTYCQSIFGQNRRFGAETVKTFKKSIELEKVREKGK